MMRSFLALLGIAVLSSSLSAEVEQGENLLINGTFDAEQVDFPEFWSRSSTKNVVYDRVGGPEGKKPSVALKTDGKSGTVSLRQQGLTLVAGETYKLSGYVKTKGFESNYAVEGNKDMLSDRYRFKYNPGFVANPDFADGLNGWTVSPAAQRSVRPHTIAGYGKNSQGPWGGGSAGDTVCVMTRNTDKPNRISQTARGLEVGRAYCLQFVTADLKDVTGRKYNPRRYGIRAELEGAEILADKGFVHIDRRNKGRYKDSNNVAKINLNRIIFRAKSPTQLIAFNDENASLGDELIVNFIQLKPYLEE